MTVTWINERFNGFPQGAFEFFEELGRHNEREWFRTHQEVYERACREPMKLLVAELAANPAKSKILRINRDLRFSRDKSPYRTYIAAGFDGNYVMISKSGLYVGAGIYKPEPDRLRKLREAIDRDASGKTLQKIVATLRRKGYNVDSHAKVASAPRGYSADHPRIDLLRMKDIFAGKTFEPGPSLSTRGALKRVKDVIRDVRPLVDWIKVNLGTASAR
jgi:uncharacterized protein (TIGR02453 family)